MKLGKLFRILIVIIIIFINFGVLFSQKNSFKAPDYQRIEMIINSKDSPYYYPRIITKYYNNDTTLTDDDYRLLYYGFFYNRHYNFEQNVNYDDSLKAVFQKKNYSDDDVKEVIRLETLKLKQFPFNISDLNYLSNSFIRLKDTMSFNAIQYKIKMITNTILSSGDGKSDSTAWHVIAVEHQYDVIKIMGLNAIGHLPNIEKGIDYVEIAPNNFGFKGFYFDVNQIIKKMNKIFEKSTKKKDLLK